MSDALDVFKKKLGDLKQEQQRLASEAANKCNDSGADSDSNDFDDSMSGKSAVSAKVTPSDWQTPELLRIILARTNPQSSASAKGMVQSMESFLDGIGLPLAPGTSRLNPTGEPESLVPFSATRRVREKEGNKKY